MHKAYKRSKSGKFGPGSQSHSSTKNSSGRILVFVILHVVLALIMRRFEIISTLHALAVFLFAVYTAMTTKEIKDIIPMLAYIAGAEVLWRMTDARIFWEFGKYATIALVMISLVRMRNIKGIAAPFLYFLLLTPSILLTLEFLGMTERARQLISFNLSGPLALAALLIFFSQMEIDFKDLQEWVFALVYPTIGILTLAVYSTITASDITFTTESMFITSGGYGPNQVSAALSLGATLLVMLAITSESRAGRFWIILFALALLIQSFLTFSRGGIYNFGVAIAGATLHLLGKPDRFIKSLFVLLIIGGILVGVFFPQLEEFSGGMFSQRFLDTDLTNRGELFEADVRLFLDNPVFGVGPGISSYRRQIGIYAAAHTEYSRILAEHGMGGVFALLILIILLARAYFKAPDVSSRAWVVALAAWPLVEMAHAAMRIVGISFLLGMAVVGWKVSPEKQRSDAKSYKAARFSKHVEV